MSSHQPVAHVAIVIPAFHEAPVIAQVCTAVHTAMPQAQIIVIDDGSADATYSAAAALPFVIALRHAINRGKGAAVKTGIYAAKILGAEYIVTMDADGQHDPADIQRLCAPLFAHTHDVVLGSRLMNHAGMPWYKVLHNTIGNFVVWILFGLWVTDSQSGFRAYTRDAICKIQTFADRYAYDSEVIREIRRHRLRFCEIPIAVRYTAYSTSKTHRMNIATGCKTVCKMIIHDA